LTDRKAALGKAIEKLEKPKAEARAREGNAAGGRGGKEVGGKFPPTSDAGKTRDKVGSAVGMSGKQYEKAKVVTSPG
jgi:hypothetical protein